VSAVEALHELRRLANDEWPRYIYADNGTRLALSNVTGRIGLYDGPDGYAMTLKDAQRFSQPRTPLERGL